MEYLCRELKLSIVLEPHPIEKGVEQIRVILGDDTLEVEECQPINHTSILSRKYHVREAVIVSVRRVLGEGWKHKLIKDGNFSNVPGASKTGSSIDLDLGR